MALPTAPLKAKLEHVQEAHFRTWWSAEQWRERIVVFNASWFTLTQGTGVVVQVLTNIPYPAQWLRNLAYCFWVLNMLIFAFFTALSVARCILYPALSKAIFLDFAQTSYLGAIPITVDTILVGILIFYADRTAAVWAAYGLWWVAVAMSLAVGTAVVFIVCAYQEPKQLESVTGVWLLSFIPFIVTSAAGSVIAPLLNTKNGALVLVISFLLWSLGEAMCFIILAIYFWRLVSQNLPAREAILSCFIPMGPTGMGAFAIQNLAVDLSQMVHQRQFILERNQPGILTTEALSAVAEAVHWLGIIIALFLIAFATFWLIEATCSVFMKIPKRFNVGLWSCVFPFGVYTNALCRLGEDLRNEGFKGWAATCVAITTLLWLVCALSTLYKGVWQAQLFFAPGLEGWNERKALESNASSDTFSASSQDVEAASETMEEPGADGIGAMADGDAMSRVSRLSRGDGTYSVARRRRKRFLGG